MAKRSINELADYLDKTKNATQRAYVRTLMVFLKQAEAYAKRNSTKQFVGRRGRKLSGRLLNSIYTEVQFSSNSELPIGVIGTRGIPYGRIHEYGGTITPKKAKHLWIKQWGPKADRWRRLTPTEFIKLKNSNPENYKIFNSKKNNLIAAYQEDNDTIPLFVLRQKVEMPERPYLRPAVNQALEEMPETFKRQLRRSLKEIYQ